MIAIGDGAATAARALAREAYSDEALRPRIDDATARVLAGEAVAAGAAAKLTEIADVRATLGSAANDSVARRLLTSLGADLGAALVLAVTVRDGRPTARVLSVAKGAFEPVELTGTIEAQPDGSSRVKWTGVTAVLTSFLAKQAPASSTSAGPIGAPAGAGSAAPKGPLAPKKDEPATSSFWTSPWTWVGIGVVAVAGVVVFAASQSQGDAGTLRLQGRVSP